MKTLSAGLTSHIALEATSLSTCWKVTRTDGTVYGFTDHDVDLPVSGVTYAAATGYTRTAIRTESNLAVDNLDVAGALSASAITEADLVAGLWDYAAVEIFEVNWADLTQGTLKHRKGRLGEVKSGKLAFEAELRGLAQFLQQQIGRTYGPDCDAVFGDTRCGLSLGAYTVTGTLTGVTSNRVFTDSGRAEAAQYFAYGKITFTGGANSGRSMEVKSFASGAFTLFMPMPYTVAIGDTYTAIAGCDKTAATCKTTFSNLANFRGFPFMAGTDQMLSGGR